MKVRAKKSFGGISQGHGKEMSQFYIPFKEFSKKISPLEQFLIKNSATNILKSLLYLQIL